MSMTSLLFWKVRVIPRLIFNAFAAHTHERAKPLQGVPTEVILETRAAQPRSPSSLALRWHTVTSEPPGRGSTKSRRRLLGLEGFLEPSPTLHRRLPRQATRKRGQPPHAGAARTSEKYSQLAVQVHLRASAALMLRCLPSPTRAATADDHRLRADGAADDERQPLPRRAAAKSPPGRCAPGPARAASRHGSSRPRDWLKRAVHVEEMYAFSLSDNHVEAPWGTPGTARLERNGAAEKGRGECCCFYICVHISRTYYRTGPSHGGHTTHTVHFLVRKM